MKSLNVVFRWVLRLLMPTEAQRMERDGALNIPSLTGEMEGVEDYVEVVDNGADVTVFAYTGLDAMFAGQPRFEFRGIFKRLSVECNLVCFRDLRRMCFHIAPDGSKTGLEFYEEKTREKMAELGAAHNVAMGSSSGGEAAFYFGTKCGMDRVLGFAPAFPHTVYNTPLNALKTFFNLRVLFTDVGSYIELIIVTLAATWADKSLKFVLKDKSLIYDMRAIYRDAGENRPEATVFYGTGSPPDVRQAKGLEEFPEVTLIPVETNRHNTPAELMKLKELGPALTKFLSFDAGDYEERKVPEVSGEESA